jgi:gliding motility-associated-like protein
MKKIILLIILLTYLIIGGNAQSYSGTSNSSPGNIKKPQQPNQKYKVKWTKDPFDKQLFIQNGGQFDTDTYSKDKIFFQVNLGNIQAYFTGSGVIYKYEKYSKKIEEKGSDPDKEERALDIKYASYNWKNANPNTGIEAKEEQNYYYTYPAGKDGSVKVNVFKKIVYKNIYPGIDIEYSFITGKAGIKYSIIAHPGSDISLVKLVYTGVSDLRLSVDGDAVIQSNVGEITDHAPVSYYGNISNTIASNYVISNANEESFIVNTKTGSTEDLIIDPFSTDPLFAINFDDVFDVDYDYNYNVYAYGSYNPFQLTKFDSSGNQLWTYNATAISANQEYGDFTVDKVTGTSYLVEGWGGWTIGSTADKVNTLGTHLLSYPGPGGGQMNEMWRAEFDQCAGKVIIGAGGNNTTSPWKQACLLDTTMTTATDVSPLGGTPSNDDVCLIAMDPMGGTVYMATSYSSEGATNQVMSLPVSTLTPVNYNVPDGYSFAEVSEPRFSIWELPSPVYANGINGMAASPNWLYMYDGYTLNQNFKSTGLNSASLSVYPTRINGLEVQVCWAGLDVDGSDNIYAGFQNSINIYNSSLTLTGNIPLIDTVYDVVLGPNHSSLYAGGLGFVSFIDITPADKIWKISSPATCGSCNGTATAQLTLSGSPVGTATYLWSTGATTSSISGLCAGTYTVTAYLNGCGSTRFTDTVIINSSASSPITITPGGPTTFCSGGSVSLAASGGTTYTWSPGTGLSSTAGATVIANPTSSQIYTVTATGACGGSATVTVTINSLPTVSASATPPTICSGSSAVLNASGATTYSWSPNTNLSATTGSSVTANPGSTITYTVNGITAGCTSANQTVVVTVNPTPSITPSATSSSICAGNSDNLNAIGATSYTWSPNTDLSATTGSPVTATPTSSITYTVTGTTAGCTSAPQTVSITVNPTPTISVSATPPTICSGNSTTLNASGATSYVWTPNIALSATTGSSITANPGSNISYTVTGTIAGCTSAPVILAITVNATPTVSITPSSPTTFCSGSSVNLTAGGATTYAWSPAVGLSATTGIVVTANPSSTETYTVTGTGAGGCTATQTVVVTVNPIPIVSIIPSGPTTFCSGGSVGLTAGGATTYTWNPAVGLSATTGAAVTANPTTTKTYTVTGTSASGCIATQTVTITVTPTPTVSVAPGSPTICPGGNVNLIASGATTYAWSPSTALSATTGTPVNATPTVTTTYTVTGTTGACTSNANVVVTVASSLNVTVTPPAPSVCAGGSIILNANGAATYSWKPATGLSCTTCSNPTATPGSTITYTVNGASGSCADSAKVTITVNPTPTISVSPPVPTVCAGGTITLTASGTANYTWSPSTGLSATTGSVVNATLASTQTYTVVGTNGSGCTDTTNVNVAVGPGPSVNISITGISPAVCGGDTIGMIASGANTYTWSPATGLNVTTGVYVIASPGITTTYTVTGTDAGGCTGTATQVITIYPTPTVTITPSATTMCSSDSVTLSAAGASTYTWSPSTGLNTTTGPNVTAKPGSTITYTVSGKSASGCTSTDSIVITVTPTPTVIVTPNTAGICNGDSVVLNASGGTTYTWSPGTGLNTTTGTTVTAIPASNTTYTVTGINGGCNSTATAAITVGSLVVGASAVSPTVCSGGSTIINAIGATNYTWSPGTGLNATTGASVTATPTVTTTYTLTGTSGASCTDSTMVTITVAAIPTVTVSASSNSVCSGTSVILTAGGATTYTWAPAASLSTSTGSPITVTPAASTTYTVYGTTAGGCSDSAVTSITVNTTPTVTISSSGNDSICNGQSITLSATSGAGNYVWSNGATTSSITVSPGSSTIYSVVAGSGACIDSAKQLVFVYPPFAVTMKSDSVCVGGQAIVNVTATGGKPGYVYTWGSGLGTGPGPKAVIISSVSPYYVCTVSDGCGDVISDSSMVYTYPTPKASFTPSPDTVEAGQFIGFVNSSTGATTYYWTFGDGGSDTNKQPYYLYNINPGPYVVTLTASNGGCKDSVSDTVFVIQTIYIPNVFTPNGDGINDVFHVTIGGMKTYSIEIFNRWGEKVFIADSPEIDWDGMSMGGVAESDGTYYYLIKATDYIGKTYNFKGAVQLIR